MPTTPAGAGSKEQLPLRQLGLHIVGLDGRGLGVVAARAFAAGERIIAEPPLLAWASAPGADGQHNWDELDEHVRRLSEQDQQVFHDLMDKHVSGDHLKTPHGIWNTNSFKTEDLLGDGLSEGIDGVRRSAVFAVCSRLNHSCKPNAHASWNSNLGRQTVHALRAIAAGEEVTVTYIGGAEAGTQSQRKQTLSSKYGFECTCEACQLTGEALKTSDARLRRQAEIHCELPRTPASELEGMVRKHLELMQLEGMPLIWGKAGLLLAIVALKGAGEYASAAKWAALGARHARAALGEDSSTFSQFARLASAFGEAAGMHGANGTAALSDTPMATARASADAATTTTSEHVDVGGASAAHQTHIGHGTSTFERGPAEGWSAARGRRELHFGLISHRQRFAHRLWPAAQALARYLDAHPALVAGRAVLEIGAGAALPSAVAGLLGARALVVSDWPDARMAQNMAANLTSNLPPGVHRRTIVVGYDWNQPPHPLLHALAELEAGDDAACATGVGTAAACGVRVAAATVPTGTSCPATTEAHAKPSTAGGFELILLSDLLYECEHEPILSAVCACLSREVRPPSSRARVLLTYQVHDRCQASRQAAFFGLAPSYGLRPTRLLVESAPRQFEEGEGEGEEEDETDGEEDVTRQVQLWELCWESTQAAAGLLVRQAGRWVFGAHGVSSEAPLHPSKSSTERARPCADQLRRLCEYAEGCLERGEIEEAQAAVLEMLSHEQHGDRRARRLLARSVDEQGGTERLLRRVPQTRESASSLAYLAMVVRAHGRIDASLQLYRRAASLSTDSATILLQRMHTLELQRDYAGALKVLAAFCDANPSRRVHTLSCAALAAHLPTEDQLAHLTSDKLGLLQDGSSRKSSASTSCAGKTVRRALTPPDMPPRAGQDSFSSPPPTVTLPEEDLALLGAFLTAVKLLFVAGALEHVPRIVEALEPVRLAVRDLHRADIHIEYSYYCYVAQLMCSMPLPVPTQLAAVYLVGDSHSLSPGWRTLSWRGTHYLLRPMLVTGLKIWHMRPESDMYTKAHLESTLHRIPQGATVIFAVGQIDCRGGLLAAVERGLYGSIAEAVEVCVGVYIAKLLEICAAKTLRILVHPVPPVMSEIRPVVDLFNNLLQERVRREPSLEWLDLVDSLVDCRTGELRKQFELDGTHLHPRYLEHVLQSKLPE